MSKRILLIDSDETFARNLQSALAGRGLAVLTATNSEQGMALAKSEGPDLIVVCVEAQPTNGYMLCTRLKKDEQLKLVPVILTSANATADSFEKHKKLKTRAEEYLIKPFEPIALLHRIGSLLRIEIPPAPPAPPLDDEPLGLGDLAFDDEPLHLTDSEAAEAHAGRPPPGPDFAEVEIESVEEVLSDPRAADAPGAPQGEHAAASDEDLDMLDAAFDALSPASRPSSRPIAAPASPPPAEEPGQAESTTAEVPLDDFTPSAETAEATAALEARVRELEEQLAAKDAELEGLRKGQSSAAELRKLKEARSKADKENVRLKEELNEKEKELIELRDQQAALEHQAQTLEDESLKREIAAKALQQRAEALAAAAKKFERELGTAREELKSLALVKGRVAELEKGEAAAKELQKQHAALREEREREKIELERHQAQAQAQKSEAEQLRAQLDEAKAEVDARAAESAQHRDRAGRLEAELADTRALHENELSSAREQHQADADELRAALVAAKDAAESQRQAHGEELAAAQRRHAEVATELEHARSASEHAQAELAAARETAARLERELAEARSLAQQQGAELAAARHAGESAQEQLAALQSSADKLRDELSRAQEAGEKLRAELSSAREESEKTQLELTGAQEQLEQARAELAAAAGEKHLLSDERDELRQQLEHANAASARSEQRAAQAYQRIEGDEKLREKTKKALQIALQLLDEVPALPDDAEVEAQAQAQAVDEPPQLEQQSA